MGDEEKLMSVMRSTLGKSINRTDLSLEIDDVYGSLAGKVMQM